MNPTTSMLDTGDGPNLVSKELLPPKWQHLVKPSRDAGLMEAKKESVDIQGVILIQIILEDLCMHAWFGGVPRIAVPMWMGTSFIDHFFKGIFPQEKRLLPMHSKTVSIIDYASTKKPLNAVSEGTEPPEGTNTDEEASTFPVRVSKGLHIPPMHTAKVLVNSSASRLKYV